jgi:aminoglycoside phosphotransferase (APT) family kinase protein
VPLTETGFDSTRLSRIVGEGAHVVADLTPPWATPTRSSLIAAAGREYVLQFGPRAAIARRASLAIELQSRAPWLPVPRVVGAEIDGAQPFVVSRRVAGTSGRELLNDDESAARLAAAMGVLSRRVADVPIRGLHLSRTWADGSRLAEAAARWLGRTAPLLSPRDLRRLGRLIDRLPERVAGISAFRPVFAHGDFAPVNVLMRDGEVVALLDLERARIAHPLFDAAWWSALVGYHHPARRRAAEPAFLAAAGLPVDGSIEPALEALRTVQFLEMVATGGTSAVREHGAEMLRWAIWGVHDRGLPHGGSTLT